MDHYRVQARAGFRKARTADRLLARAKTVLRAIRSRDFVGSYELECPLCGFSGLFGWAGDPPRRDARCPMCHSLERHRLMKLWFDQNEGLLQGGSALHFAPEPGVVRIFKPVAGQYATADITPGRADLALDIEALPQDMTATYDWILCSHILEHVDDRKALAGLHRVLKPKGTLLILVPIVEGWLSTYEDPSVQTKADRSRYFGQWNHVRYYGADIRERITAAGFDLEEFTAAEPQVSQYGLIRGEKVFVATKG